MPTISEEQINQLFKSYYKPLYNYAYTLVREWAEDIVMDVFAQVHASDSVQLSHQYMKNYMFISVKHRSIDFIRRINALKMERIIEDYNEIGIEINVEDTSTVGNIMKIVETLPLRQRQVILMSEIEGYSNAQIGKILGIAERSVINHKHVGMKNLRKLLKDEITV